MNQTAAPSVDLHSN